MIGPETRNDSLMMRTARGVFALFFKGVLPLTVLAVAGIYAKEMIENPPTAPRSHGERRAKLVDIHTAQTISSTVTVEAYGNVIPAQEVELKPQVNGKIEWLTELLIPGEHIKQGEPLLRIETRDYELAIARAQSQVHMAEASLVEAQRQLTYADRDLKLEMGSQSVAKRDYELLKDEISDSNRDLVLRKPQLEAAKAEVGAAKAGIESAEAALESAKAQLEQTKLDLERTTITAPFNAIIEEKLVDRGDTVTTNIPLVRLVGSDEFWIELAVPLGDLKWIQLPEPNDGPGAEVRIYNTAAWGEDVFRMGHLLRRLPGVDNGRMARILATVDDPLALESQSENNLPLLAATYVRAEITGKPVDSTVVLPQELVRQNNEVWVMGDDNLLQIRKVRILYRGRNEILIASGIEPGDKVIVTELTIPVEGMPLRTEDLQSQNNATLDAQPAQS